METTASTPQEDGTIPQKPNFIQRALDNPVVLKELRGRMRGKQAFILLTLYLGLIVTFIVIVYNTVSISSSLVWDPGVREQAGKAVFGTVVLLELLLLSFIAPGLTAGAITAERERQTFDILRTTLLSASSFVLGKLGSSFAYLLLLILVALPLQSIAFLIGGVGFGELIISSLILVVTAIFFCTLGIFLFEFYEAHIACHGEFIRFHSAFVPGACHDILFYCIY